jgi:hypothetical protein
MRWREFLIPTGQASPTVVLTLTIPDPPAHEYGPWMNSRSWSNPRLDQYSKTSWNAKIPNTEKLQRKDSHGSIF